MKNFIISPPFGSLISHHKCTSVLGTYTLKRRGGWLNKIYRGILTIRPIKDGWVNNIGLQNPGIKSIKNFQKDKIYSIAAIENTDWDELINFIPKDTKVELNLSCPNIDHKIEILDNQIIKYLEKFPIVIFKLSPTSKIYEEIDRFKNLGVKYFHIFNTIPVSQGGESGKRLKEFSIKTISNIRNKYKDIKIIGGGGIYSINDVEDYKKAGADYFSLASIWFKPWVAINMLRNF